MKINIEELKEWRDNAQRGIRLEVERIEEKGQMLNGYQHILDAMDALISENENLREQVDGQQQEIDDLEEQLEQKDAEIVELRQRLLASENQQLVAEVKTKPMEIHNHFEAGSNSQVYNDKVSGRFEKIVKKDKKEKKDKKRWKKIVRKML